jgi:predicted metal-binding transcription factor (methanogenesis marker protein 9)
MELNREEVQMVNKYIKKCSNCLVIKEIQIKTKLRFHLTPVKMARIKGNNNNKCWQGCGKTGTLTHFWWECKLSQPLWKTV